MLMKEYVTQRQQDGAVEEAGEGRLCDKPDCFEGAGYYDEQLCLHFCNSFCMNMSTWDFNKYVLAYMRRPADVTITDTSTGKANLLCLSDAKGRRREILNYRALNTKGVDGGMSGEKHA